MKFRTCAVVAFAFVCTTGASFGQQAAPAKGFYSFGRPTIADIGKLEWAPLKLEGLPEGIEIATLRVDLGKAAEKSCCVPFPDTLSQTIATPVMNCISG